MLFRSAVGIATGLAAGLQFFNLMHKGQPLLRPPGVASEQDFLARCVRCGSCVLACPYDVLHVCGEDQGTSVGTPAIIPRQGACRLCVDFPCIAACPTEALHAVEQPRDVRMGVAVINRDLCLSFKGMRCEVCYRSCPLIDEAIFIKHSLREGDSIHAIFEPVINPEACVGCGICEERCVVHDPTVAIRIRPNSAQEYT